MTAEWGLFNDEGCVERGLWSEQEADRRRGFAYNAEDDLRIEELCPDHDEQPLNGCEDCGSEE